MGLNDTPKSDRIHIGIFGKRNSGKSSLINALTGQQTAIVSDIAGTTTDPVYQSMEIYGIGPCVLIDTAGFDDIGALGSMRVEQAKKVVEKTDIAILVFSDKEISEEMVWAEQLKKENIPIIAVINKSDLLENTFEISKVIQEKLNQEPVVVSAAKREGIEKLREEFRKVSPHNYLEGRITAHLVNPGDVVLLVMPQDIQAPKGRLILPQVQTIRDLLDGRCIVVSIPLCELEAALQSLKEPPNLIITDSQVFREVYKKKPSTSRITSFSFLFAAYKGDIQEFIKGASAVDTLTEASRILIAEACTHVPLKEDIGREQIPRILRERVGKNLKIDIVNGKDFPDDLMKYDLIIHCGACMFTRKYVLTRVKLAKQSGIPITNYGVFLAKCAGILQYISY